MSAERRQHRRYTINRIAKFQTDAGALPRDCMITDISKQGARLFADGVEMPDQFHLLISGDKGIAPGMPGGLAAGRRDRRHASSGRSGVRRAARATTRRAAVHFSGITAITSTSIRKSGCDSRRTSTVVLVERLSPPCSIRASMFSK